MNIGNILRPGFGRGTSLEAMAPMIKIILIFAVALAFIATVLDARAQTAQVSCSGSLIEPTSMVPAVMSVRLGFAPRAVTVDDGKGAVTAKVVSNNKLQLKFQTKQYVGEYFHYTGDLFFIYPSGHLARLTCYPG